MCAFLLLTSVFFAGFLRLLDWSSRPGTTQVTAGLRQPVTGQRARRTCTLHPEILSLLPVFTASRPRCLYPPLPAFWLWLAMAAGLLMAIAPVVSYGLQAWSQGHADHSAHTGTHPLSGAHETGQVHTPTTQASAHASHAVDHGHHPVASPATAHTDGHPAGHGLATIAADPTADAAASNPHAEHGAACDYCLIAARALGVLLALLWLLPAPRGSGTAPSSPPAVIAGRLAWPAHAARGPPLIA